MRIVNVLFFSVLALTVAVADPIIAEPRAQLATQGIDEGWYSKAVSEIEKSEYTASFQTKDTNGKSFKEPKLHFANRNQNLRSYIGRDSYSLQPREASADWRWSYNYTGLYRGKNKVDAVSNKDAPAIDSNGSVTIKKSNNVTEWYKNSKAGILQGYTILEKPSGAGLLSIQGVVDTNLRGVSTDDSLTFSDNNKDVLQFKEIKAWDSNGKPLNVVIKYHDNKKIVELVVNDTNAVYPITVDPLATSTSWTAESNQAFAYFATSVSTAGDVNGDGYSDVIIGASFFDNGQTNEGRAFVYHGSANGLSTTANWTAESNQAEASFGTSVSTAGDVNGDGYSDVIVGASSFDNGHSNEGRAYVYHGSAGGLSTTANWTAESDQVESIFGYSVRTAGDVNGDGFSDVIIGAYFFDNGQSEEGRAYVFHGGVSGLSATANWTAESDQASAFFGNSVSTAGDVNGDGYSDVIVGANRFDNGHTDEGSAFVYHGSASGLSNSANWTAEANQADARFGWSVSAAGDVNGDGYSDVIVGAQQFDNGETDEGSAFVYYGSAGGLNSSADWTADADLADARFGWSVSTAGDVNGDGYSDVMVQAIFFSNGQTDEGRAFVYHGSSSGLSTTANWTAESDQASATFGNSASTAGDVNGDGYSDVLIGASNFDNGQTDEGRAFVYHGSAGGLSTTSNWNAESDDAGAEFGYSVSTAGDVNGDGYSDVIVGAYNFDGGQSAEGKAFVYHGSSIGLSATPNWTFESNEVNAWFGYSVSTAGDVNGDGYSDVIVGGIFHDNGQSDEGRAFVFHGSASGLSSSTNWSAESDQVNAWFGHSVGTAGDVNGDGYSDVIVGAAHFGNGQTNEGRAYVYHGSSSGLSVTSNWAAESNQADAEFGYSVNTAGDVNRDGYSDVIVGANFFDNGQTNEGRAYVYHGTSSGLSGTPNWTAESNQANAEFGVTVNTAGDVNGDGYSDVIIGAPRFDNGQTDEGRAHVYHGSSGGLNASANWTVESNLVDTFMGNSVATAGDVNGDGYSDVIVGARGFTNGEAFEGAAFVYHGSPSGVSSTSSWTAESNQEAASFGYSVGTAGDVNGDGYSDVIVGVRFYSNPQTYEGGAFVYYGNEALSLVSVPEQLNSSSVRVETLGKADTTSFRIRLLAKPASGRSRARLIREVKTFGTSFNGADLSFGSWATTGLTGSLIEESITGLTDGQKYHWRARLQYFPYMNFGPWVSAGNNGSNEQDFKVVVPTATPTPTVTPTSTPTQTPTVTPTRTPTPTVTPTATNTSTPTVTPTFTPTSTNTPTPTPTPTHTNTPTPTNTTTPTVTPTLTITPTDTETPTPTPVPLSFTVIKRAAGKGTLGRISLNLVSTTSNQVVLRSCLSRSKFKQGFTYSGIFANSKGRTIRKFRVTRKSACASVTITNRETYRFSFQQTKKKTTTRSTMQVIFRID